MVRGYQACTEPQVPADPAVDKTDARNIRPDRLTVSPRNCVQRLYPHAFERSRRLTDSNGRPTRIADLVADMRVLAPILIVLEATGGLELPVVAAFPVSRSGDTRPWWRFW
jgi:hypothetical protein